MALSPSAYVTITVLDVNDNLPELNQRSYSFITNSEGEVVLLDLFFPNRLGILFQK